MARGLDRCDDLLRAGIEYAQRVARGHNLLLQNDLYKKCFVYELTVNVVNAVLCCTEKLNSKHVTSLQRTDQVDVCRPN
jgi:hypothetical protein